jgi:hypothetical protein
MSILAARLSVWPSSVKISSTIVVINLLSLISYWRTIRNESVRFGTTLYQGTKTTRTMFCNDNHGDRFCSNTFITPFAWKLPRIVLFGREKIMRFNPSNSSNFTGGGSIGTRRTMEDSTCGGGLKSFRDTSIILSTLAYN